LSGFNQLIDVLNQLKTNKKLRIFLLSFFIFTIPTQTIILLASYFGADLNEISWSNEETMQSGLIIAIIVIQILAAAGAYLGAKSSNRFGNINTLIGINVLWAVICFFGYFVSTPFEFYCAAGFIGLGMGGIQSLSRSTYSKLIDEKYSTSYFSFYDVSQKLSIVIGTSLYATMDIFTGSIRLAILLFALLFIPSIYLLFKMSKS
jgi:UMF1 family MFS transporter